MNPRLLLVSNRLPVGVQAERRSPRLAASPGGLVTALQAAHARAGGQWLGWPGDLSTLSAADREAADAHLQAHRLVPVPITTREMGHHEDGFSDGVLRPLLHYQIDKMNLDAEVDWHVYRRVNRRFADAVAAVYRPGDVVWIHDYPLALVPGYLRAAVPGARIGFFLHAPFPGADVFRILPWREEILRGLLGADLVGFHTPGYRHHFAHACSLLLGLDAGPESVDVAGRPVRLGVHPIGIDAAAFAEAAARPDVVAEVERLRAGTAGKRIVLGVDELDAMKGIPRGLLAIDRLLFRESPSQRNIHYIQVAAPAREETSAHDELRRSVSEIVGRLNVHHGSALGAPVHVVHRQPAFAELVALYRAADVMLVTPLREGMSLVAKEYVAARTDERGVLVLSELAGAADELEGALHINPYDLEGVAGALRHALDMSPEEQGRRMRAMRARVAEADVHAWCAAFLGSLSESSA